MLPVALCWSLGWWWPLRVIRSCSRLDAGVCLRVLYDGRNSHGQVAALSVLDSRKDVFQGYGNAYGADWVEITVSHPERIPKDKPVMLVCAPHANQFVDAMVISTHLPRKIYYVGAASSFRKYKVVGFFMKLMASIIPVERHQDVKKVLTGKATVKDGHILVGFFAAR